MLQDDFSYKPLCLCISETTKESLPVKYELYKLGTSAYEVLTPHLQVVLLLEWTPFWEWRCIALDHVKISIFSGEYPRYTELS